MKNILKIHRLVQVQLSSGLHIISNWIHEIIRIYSTVPFFLQGNMVKMSKNNINENNLPTKQIQSSDMLATSVYRILTATGYCYHEHPMSLRVLRAQTVLNIYSQLGSIKTLNYYVDPRKYN